MPSATHPPLPQPPPNQNPSLDGDNRYPQAPPSASSTSPTPSNLHAALEAWTTILGSPAQVSRDQASGLGHYHDPWKLGGGARKDRENGKIQEEEEPHVPGAALRPRSVEDIQRILEVAGRFGVPLWTVSRGKNLGYGGAAPVVRGSVILDLQDMRRILHVSEEHAYAIVEPGVSFLDLHRHIRARGLRLWISTPALGWGSIVGNCLERGFGYTVTGDHAQQQCGMEVVLPDGEVVRTGMGALKEGGTGEGTWALYKGGFGPSVDGLFYQSNLGVVTKMGIWLMPAPNAYMTCTVSVPQEEDLVPLVAKLSDFQRRNLIHNHPSITNPFRQAMAGAKDPHVMQQLGPLIVQHAKSAIPEAALLDIAAAHGWGYWKAHFALYGPATIVTASWTLVQEAFASIPGARCAGDFFEGVDGGPVAQADLPDEDIPQSGIPHVRNIGLMDYRGPNSGHTCFSPMLPASGRELYDWYLTAKARTAAAGFDFFADFHVFPRHIIAIDLVVFAPDEAERCDALYGLLAEDAIFMGYSEYRTHVKYMDLIAGHFDHNGGALRKFVDGLKDAVDPKGILSPGKQGIWGSKSKAKKEGAEGVA